MNATDRGAATDRRWGQRLALSVALTGVIIGMAACSPGSGAPAMTASAVIAPSIQSQPADQSTPMGLSAHYSVSATGSDLQYQWAKNGAPIANATASAYTTPATAFSDTGATFTVTVSNSAGTIHSAPASLAVTARAPAAGDLRFHQVDAESTVNGWATAGAGLSTDLPGRSAEFYSPSLGTPLFVGGGNCGAVAVTNGTGCSWFFTENPYAPADSNNVLTAGYASDSYDDFQADLSSPVWPAFNNGTSPSSASSVITSIDFEPANALFALSWVQSPTGTGFSMFQNTVALADLQAAATQEGAGSRVITAVSNNGGQIAYFSYGWNADTATIYEVQVSMAPPSGVSAAAANLAAAGYIITATGQADDAGDVVLVGTRVQGDMLPRAFIAAQGNAQFQALQQGGFANVAVGVDLTQSSPYTYFGER